MVSLPRRPDRWLPAVIALVPACTTSFQSARVVPRGRTQVTLGMAHGSAGARDDGSWAGEVQARAGVASGFDAGVRLARSPSFDDAISAVAIDGKLQVVPHRLSIGLPAAVAWTDGGELAYALLPTAFLGFDVTPFAEVVLAPKLLLSYGDAGLELGAGANLGVRFTDLERTIWALHPEVGVTVTATGGTVITFGVGSSFGG